MKNKQYLNVKEAAEHLTVEVGRFQLNGLEGV